MITLNHTQIDSIRSCDDFARAVASSLDDPSVVSKPSAEVTDAEWLDLEDACYDVLTNSAPVVEELDAEQSKGVYTISIMGVPGAYFVFAPEYDREGAFSSLREARAYVDSEHGEYLISDDSTINDAQDLDDEQLPETDPFEPQFSDELLEVLSGEEIESSRNRILSDSSLILLANGVISSVIKSPKGMHAALKSFAKTLPKTPRFSGGMARHYRMRKLEARAHLYWLLNGRLPTGEKLSELFEL